VARLIGGGGAVRALAHRHARRISAARISDRGVAPRRRVASNAQSPRAVLLSNDVGKNNRQWRKQRCVSSSVTKNSVTSASECGGRHQQRKWASSAIACSAKGEESIRQASAEIENGKRQT